VVDEIDAPHIIVVISRARLSTSQQVKQIKIVLRATCIIYDPQQYMLSNIVNIAFFLQLKPINLCNVQSPVTKGYIGKESV